MQQNPLERMQLAHRDLRVTAGERRPRLSPGLGVGANRFVQMILARYAGLRPGRWPLGMVFLQAQTGLLVQHVTRHHRLSLMPHMTLTLLAWPRKGNEFNRGTRQRTLMPARGSDQAGPAWSGSSPVSGEPNWLPLTLIKPAGITAPAWFADQPPHATPTNLEQSEPSAPAQASPKQAIYYLRQQNRAVVVSNPRLIHRLLSRQERGPSTAAHPVPLALQRLGAEPTVRHAPSVAPVPRVVLQPAQRGLETESPRPVSNPWPEALQPPALQTKADRSQLTDPEPFQLNRLADRVVQVIDERIIARRERIGRS